MDRRKASKTQLAAWTNKRSTHVSTNPKRLELAVERRTFHANEFGGARNVAREPADLGDQVVPLEHFPCLTQRQPHDVLAIVAGRHRRYHRTNILRQQVGRDGPFPDPPPPKQ